MLELLRESHGQPTTRFCIPDEHVYQRIGEFLASEPRLEDDRRPVREGKAHGRAGVQHYHHPRISVQDPLDQLSLEAWKIHAVPVITFRLPVRVRPNNDYGEVRTSGRTFRRYDHLLSSDVPILS